MSKRIFSNRAINLFQLERDEWEFPLHKHNFFELIFIERGKGLHRLNNVTFEYEKGAIFLLTPEDEHEFEIEEKTTFGYLKFTEQLLSEKAGNNPNSKWQQKIQNVLLNPNSSPSDVVSDETDREHLFLLLKLLRVEYARNDLFSRQATLELFGAMMVILGRNINKKSLVITKYESKEEEKISNMLAYIRQHVLDKEKVQLKAIAGEYLMSPNYVSIFLKKHTGLSIQKLVLETKMKTAERLLKQSNLTISEIANNLGFTDVSHFNKLFKKYRGILPSLYRKGA